MRKYFRNRERERERNIKELFLHIYIVENISWNYLRIYYIHIEFFFLYTLFCAINYHSIYYRNNRSKINVLILRRRLSSRFDPLCKTGLVQLWIHEFLKTRIHWPHSSARITHRRGNLTFLAAVNGFTVTLRKSEFSTSYGFSLSR